MGVGVGRAEGCEEAAVDGAGVVKLGLGVAVEGLPEGLMVGSLLIGSILGSNVDGMCVGGGDGRRVGLGVGVNVLGSRDGRKLGNSEGTPLGVTVGREL